MRCCGKSGLRWLLLVVAVALTAACGGRLLNLRILGIGVRVLVEEDVDAEIHATEDQEWNSTVLGHVMGEEMCLEEDGDLSIGDTSYGKVHDGDTIRITQTGLTVSGEHRGPLPPDD